MSRLPLLNRISQQTVAPRDVGPAFRSYAFQEFGRPTVDRKPITGGGRRQPRPGACCEGCSHHNGARSTASHGIRPSCSRADNEQRSCQLAQHVPLARQMTWEIMDRFRTNAMGFVFEGTATAHGVAVSRAPRLLGQLLARPHPLLGWRNWRVGLDVYDEVEDLRLPGARPNQYMTYEFWLAVFDEWQPAAVESFFFRLAGQDPSLAGVSTAMMTADNNPGSLQAQFLRIALERGRPLVPGIDGRVDDQTFLTRSESNGAIRHPAMGHNPTLTDEVPRLAVHAIRLIRFEDLNLHVRSIRLQFSRPGGPDSRVVVEAVRDDIGFFRETFVDREIEDFEFRFPDSPDPSPFRYWYEPLSIDVTIINGTLEEESIHWTLTTVISTAGNP